MAQPRSFYLYRIFSSTHYRRPQEVRVGTLTTFFSRVYLSLHQMLVTDANLFETGEADAMSAKDKVVAWTLSHSPIDEQDSEEDDPPLQDTSLLPQISSEGHLDALHEISSIYKSAEFRWLVHNLVLCLESGPELEAWTCTRSEIVESFTLERTIQLRLDWDPRQFLREQYGHLPAKASLVDVIVLSGSTGDACADTCGAYVRRVWPMSGQDLLMTLQKAINAEDCSSLASLHGTKVSFDGTRTFIDIHGDPLHLLETAEASVWLSTSCRAATKDCVQNARTSVLRDDPERPSFTSTNQITDDDSSSSAVCWHGMFRNPVIAEAYPMPGRDMGEKGLELSVELMLSLACAFWAVTYNESLVLKGVSTMLVPTLKIGDSVVWHLRANTDGSRLSYNSGSSSSCIRDLDDAIFAGARHFVGWTTSTEYLVGKPQRSACYHLLMQYSSLHCYEPQLTCPLHVTNIFLMEKIADWSSRQPKRHVRWDQVRWRASYKCRNSRRSSNHHIWW